MRVKHRLTLREIFAVPLALFVLTGIGLVTALLGAGWWDIISWAGLSAPVAVIVWARRRARRRVA